MPYGSARDLPSFQQMGQQIAAFKLLGFLLSADQRKELQRLEREQRRIADLVDAFYALLGERNWVFTGDLNMPAIEQVVDTKDPEIAESRLIAYYQQEDRILFPLRRLHRFEAARFRIPLLRKALTDYQERRYYSSVLVLLAMMDGFVNDLEKSTRQGLHARDASDMVAWDSVVGHHLGLSHAHQSFVRGFYRTDETETTELYRNGIMHGVLVNFDNETVATKAWNRLFAVADWADAREKQAAPPKAEPSLRESVERWQGIQKQKARLEAWEPHDCSPEDQTLDECDVYRTTETFLSRWKAGQWGPLGQQFMQFGSQSEPIGKLAALAKDLYSPLPLTEWQIHRVHHVAAAVAQADVSLTVNKETYSTDLRWVRIGNDGHSAAEWEEGQWRLSLYGPTHFLTDESRVTPA